MKKQTSYLIFLLAILFSIGNKAISQIAPPSVYTSLSVGNYSLSDTIGVSEKWYKWTIDSVATHVYFKANTRGSKYTLANIELYALESGSLTLINNGAIGTDSIANLWNKDLNGLNDLYIKVITDNSGCSICDDPAFASYNFELANITAKYTDVTTLCELVTDGTMDGHIGGCSFGVASSPSSYVATGWHSPVSTPTTNASPDYFSDCTPMPTTTYSTYVNTNSNFASNGLCTVGTNTIGGYSGLYASIPASNPPYREYIYNALSAPLTMNKPHYVSLWVRLSCFSRYATKDLNLYFTTGAPAQPAVYSSGIYVPSVITPTAGSLVSFTTSAIDTKTDWTILTACFTPTAAFTHVTFGNFQPYGAAVSDLSQGSWTYSPNGTIPNTHADVSYYYVDNVSIIPLKLNATGAGTLCSGQPTQLNADLECPLSNSFTPTYSWTPSTGLSATNISNPQANPSVTTIYTVTATIPNADGSTCSLTQTINVNVTSGVTPTLNITPTQTICQGSSATLTVTGADTYTWSTSSNSATITVNPSSTMGYTVWGSGPGAGCTSTISTEVYVIPTLPITLSSNTIICEGGNATLTASNSISSYTWLPAGSGSSITVTPSVTTTYTVIGTNSCGQIKQAVATVTVLPAPGYTVSTTTVCAGSAVSVTSNSITQINSTNFNYPNPLTPPNSQNPHTYNTAGNYSLQVVASTGLGACQTTSVIPIVVATPTSATMTYTSQPCTMNYTFLVNSGCTGGAYNYYFQINGGLYNNSNITGVFPYTFSSSGTYTIMVISDFDGVPVTYTVTVPPVTYPTVSASASPTTICSGQSTTLTASGALVYTWAPGGSSNPLVVNPLTTTVYTVTGINAVGCTDTKTVSVTVNSSLSLSVTASSATVCAGTAATLTASGASTYTWNGVSATSTLAVAPLVTTVYTVTGTNAFGCTGTNTIQVDVIPNLGINVTPSSNSICPGGTATLTAPGGASYTWTPGNLNTASISVTPSVSTVYTLSASNATCGVRSNTILITVVSPTVTATASPTTVCSGVSTTLTASGSSTYTWDPGAITGASAVVTPTIINISTKTIIYTVTATDAAGCVATNTVGVLVKFPIFNISGSSFTICAGTTKTLTATQSGFTYDWQPVGASGYSVVVSPSVTTVYSVTGTSTSTGCSATKTINVVVNPFTLINVSPPSICSGQSATLSVPGATSYTWSTGAGTSSIVVSPTTTTSYTVTGSGGACTSSLVITVTVNPIPTVTASASSTAICSGQNATLTAGGATTYSWSPGGLSANPLTVNPGSSTVYTVTGTSLGCSNTGTVSLSVLPIPTISISPSPSGALCSGATTTLTATGATSYTWSTGATTSTVVLTMPSSTVTTINFYTVTATGSSGCTNTRGWTIVSYPYPSFSVTASPTIVCLGNSSILTASASGGYYYTWTPGPIVSTLPVSVSPTVATVYTVSAKNGNCYTTHTVEVNVNPVPSLSVSVNPTLTCLDSATLTASGATAYTWNPGAVSSATAVVSPTATTVYTVIGTNTVGCSSTATVSVEKDDSYCCRPSVKTFTTGSISTQTNVTSMGALLVDVTGTLTINTSTFNFTNTLIRMAPNAKLIVAPSCSVTLSSAHLFSCDNMWEGIELKDDSRLLANTAASSPSPTLDDAHTAIYVDATGMTNPATIDLTDLVLSKNRVGIKITNSSGSSAYPLSMSAVTLQGDVATPYSPGTTLKPYIGGSGTVTFPSTEYGVQAVNVEAITVGSSAGGARNTFRSMQNGVRLEQSNAHVERCDFMDFGTAYNNKGIWAAGDLTSPSSPPGYVYYGTKHRFLVGQGTGNDCSFTNLKYGIYSDSCMTSYIQDNTFNDINGTGIAVYRCNFIRGIELTPTMIAASDRDTAYVYNNTMAPLGAGANLMQNGVGMFENYYLKGIIYANSMDLKPATGVWSEGVGIYHATTNYSSSYTTTGNLITGTGNYGVHEVNDASIDPGTIPRAIESNTITVGTGSCSGTYNTPNIGVYCVNSPLAVIKENTIDETSISGMPSCMIGIMVDNGSADYLGCNLIKNTGVSTAVNLDNLNSIFRGNVMDRAQVGLNLASGTMGNLGSSTTDAGQNEWINTTRSSRVDGGGLGSNIYYDSGTNRFPNSNVAPFGTAFTPVLSTTSALGCTQHHRGGSSSLIQPNDNNNDLVTDLINGTLQFPQYNEGLLWEHRYGILSLLKDSLLDNGNPVFAQFRQDQDNTNLGRINSLMRSLGNYADVLTHSSSYGQSLGAISTNTNVVEQNYKLFMGAYIDYVAGEANESAYSSIQQLAQQCPYSDGAVVYNARALMKAWGDETLYRNECEAIDIQSDDQLKLAGNTEQNTKAENVLVYPNPNSGSFSVAYTFTQLKNTFELYDLVGRKIIEKTLNGTEGIENINLDRTDNGVYFYKVSDANDKLLFTGKLIISK